MEWVPFQTCRENSAMCYIHGRWGREQEGKDVMGQGTFSSWDTIIFLSVEQRKAFAISVLAAGV